MLSGCKSRELCVCRGTSPAERPLWTHSFLRRTVCLAKSRRRIGRVSSLDYQLALGDLCSQSTLHTAMCPDTSGKSLHWVTHSTLVSLCRGLPATQESNEDERPRQYCGWGFIHSCLQNRDCSHRQHMTIFFPFLHKLDILLFCPLQSEV